MMDEITPVHPLPEASPPPRKRCSEVDFSPSSGSPVRILVTPTEEVESFFSHVPLAFDNVEQVWKPCLTDDQSTTSSPKVPFIPISIRALARKWSSQSKGDANTDEESEKPSGSDDVCVEAERHATPSGSILRRASFLKSANCVIPLPRKRLERPSLSHINLPCYRRKPSGKALDINYHPFFNVVR